MCLSLFGTINVPIGCREVAGFPTSSRWQCAEGDAAPLHHHNHAAATETRSASSVPLKTRTATHMDRSDQLQQIFTSSRFVEVLTSRIVDFKGPFTALRFQSNTYRLRAIEIWEGNGKPWFRIYYSDKISPELKALIDGVNGFERKTSTTNYTDYYGDPEAIAAAVGNILIDGGAGLVTTTTPVLTKNSAYEGLPLPDVDVSETDVLGRTFTWKK
jgi:hypothetical protein